MLTPCLCCDVSAGGGICLFRTVARVVLRIDRQTVLSRSFPVHSTHRDRSGLDLFIARVSRSALRSQYDYHELVSCAQRCTDWKRDAASRWWFVLPDATSKMVWFHIWLCSIYAVCVSSDGANSAIHLSDVRLDPILFVSLPQYVCVHPCACAVPTVCCSDLTLFICAYNVCSTVQCVLLHFYAASVLRLRTLPSDEIASASLDGAAAPLAGAAAPFADDPAAVAKARDMFWGWSVGIRMVVQMIVIDFAAFFFVRAPIHWSFVEKITTFVIAYIFALMNEIAMYKRLADAPNQFDELLLMSGGADSSSTSTSVDERALAIRRRWRAATLGQISAHAVGGGGGGGDASAIELSASGVDHRS